MTVPDRTIELISSDISAGRTDAAAEARRALDAAERLNGTLNAFLQIAREGALGRAEQLDRDAGAGGRLRVARRDPRGGGGRGAHESLAAGAVAAAAGVPSAKTTS